MNQQMAATGLLGIVVGFAVTVGLSATVQPENVTIEQRLARIEQGLFKPDSALLLDDDRSIEQMLEQIRIQVAGKEGVAPVARLEPNGVRLRELDRTVTQLARSVEILDREKISSLRDDLDRFKRQSNSHGGTADTSRLRDLSRSVADLRRSLQSLDRYRVADLRRDLDDLKRNMSGNSSVNDVRRSVDRVESSMRRLERRVSSLEQRIR